MEQALQLGSRCLALVPFPDPNPRGKKSFIYIHNIYIYIVKNTIYVLYK